MCLQRAHGPQSQSYLGPLPQTMLSASMARYKNVWLHEGPLSVCAVLPSLHDQKLRNEAECVAE